ncbi:MAG: glycoside hydrolase family 25 protein, partial [Parascardovia denticolens]
MGSHQDENGMAQARAGKGGKTFGRFMASLLAFSLGVAALAPALSARTAWADSAVASQVQAAGQAQEQTQGQGQEPTRPSNQAQGEVQGQTLPQTVATSVPNDAVVVSPTLAASPDGTVYQTRTGRKVSAQEAESVAGTSAVPADPLAKTGGDSFIPVEVSELRQSQQNGQQGSQPNIQQNNQPSSFEASTLVVRKKPAKTSRTINPSAWASGPYWGSANGTPAFYNANGSLFAQRAKRVIDVSSWQGNVDWAAVKAAGIQGAIIRIGYGNDIADSKAQRNISECRRLGIPFGLYHYSYAYNASFAAAEGESVARFLKRYGVSVKDLAYPIYYDLEAWSWSEHTRPSDPATYRGIVNAFYAALTKAGYGSRLGVYSYTSYLTTALNDSSIHQKTSWVAQYGANMGFTGLTSDFRGWQYSSQGTVKGVSGSVDLNAFGYSTAASSESSGSSSNQGRGINMARLPIVTVPHGSYYVNVQQKDSVSL